MRICRRDDTLEVTLNRPHVRNALNRHMRRGLAMAGLDGPNFLEEFWSLRTLLQMGGPVMRRLGTHLLLKVADGGDPVGAPKGLLHLVKQPQPFRGGASRVLRED